MIKIKYNLQNGLPDTNLVFMNNESLSLRLTFFLYYSDFLAEYYALNLKNDDKKIYFLNYEKETCEMWMNIVSDETYLPKYTQKNIFTLIDFMQKIKAEKYVNLGINFYTIVKNDNIQNFERNVIPIQVDNYFEYINNIYILYKKNCCDEHDFIKILSILIFRRENIFKAPDNWDLNDIISIITFCDRTKKRDILEFISQREDVIQNNIIKNDPKYALLIMQYYKDFIKYLDFKNTDLSLVNIDKKRNKFTFMNDVCFEHFIDSKLIYNKTFFEMLIKHNIFLIYENMNHDDVLQLFDMMLPKINTKYKAAILCRYDNSKYYYDNISDVIELLRTFPRSMFNIPENVLHDIMFNQMCSSTVIKNILVVDFLRDKLDENLLYNTKKGIRIICENHISLLDRFFHKIKKESYAYLLECKFDFRKMINSKIIYESLFHRDKLRPIDFRFIKEQLSENDQKPFYFIFNDSNIFKDILCPHSYPNKYEKQQRIRIDLINFYNVDVFCPDDCNVIILVTKYRDMDYYLYQRILVLEYEVHGLTDQNKGIYLKY